MEKERVCSADAWMDEWLIHPVGRCPWYYQVKAEDVVRMQIDIRKKRGRDHSPGRDEPLFLSPAGYVLRYAGNREDLVARYLEDSLLAR